VTTWTNADFEQLSWHDCCVYGLRIVEGEHGTGGLELDLDYLVEWVCHTDRRYEFRVAPATLTFHEIFRLRMLLDYAAVSAGTVPFSLDGVEREAFSYPNGHQSFRWVLKINWPGGSISFESPGFTQALTAEPVLLEAQSFARGSRPVTR